MKYTCIKYTFPGLVHIFVYSDSHLSLNQLYVLQNVCLFVCLFDLILYVPSTIFQLNRDGSSWVEPVLSYDKCVLLKDHNAVTPVRLEPAAPRSRVKHCTIEPLHSLSCRTYVKHASLLIIDQKFPVLNSTCSLHVGYTGIMKDINIVELSPHRECPMRFFFQNGLQLCHISKETHAFWRSNKLFLQ